MALKGYSPPVPRRAILGSAFRRTVDEAAPPPYLVCGSLVNLFTFQGQT